MAQFPALPLWTDAYLADCGHLTDAEHGRYLMILVAMWRAPNCRIPNDDEWLARKFRRTIDAVKTELRPIINEFCESDGNWICQNRLLRERNHVEKSSKKQSERAKSRWKNEKPLCRGNATSGNAPTPTPTPTSIIDADEARAREATPDEVGKEVLTILGVLNDPTWYGNWGRVHQWMADGASPENDIYPTIKRVMAKRGSAGPPGNLKYFDQAVADAIKSRTEKLPDGRITQDAQTGHLSTEERAARILERLERERPRRVGGGDRANGGDVVSPSGSG